MNEQPKVFVATPTSGGVARVKYVASLFGLAVHLERNGIQTLFGNLDGLSIAEQRDALAFHFLERSNATHLLFVDSDIQFPPDLANKLLQIGEPFIATTYSKRMIDLQRVVERASSGDADSAVARAYQFNGVPLENGVVTVQNGLCEMSALPLGFSLLRRDCFEQIAASNRVVRYPSQHAGETVFAFFREIELPTGERLSEDYSFSRRWRACGGKVLAYVCADIKHIGDFSLSVPYMEYLSSFPRAEP
jgi:hypothetical protein